MNPVGTVGWIDLTVADATSLRDFYAPVAGWTPADGRLCRLLHASARRRETGRSAAADTAAPQPVRQVNAVVALKDMTLNELKRLIQTADWFANLGMAAAAPGVVPVTDLSWQRLIAAATRAEFGLPHDGGVFDEAPFAEMEWLPTANEEPDPIHGRSLEQAARGLGREAEFTSARLEGFRLALASQRAFPDRPILKVEPTNSNEAARRAGRFACRIAASEIVVDQGGFSCEMVRLFHKGYWPFGRLPSREVVVL